MGCYRSNAQRFSSSHKLVNKMFFSIKRSTDVFNSLLVIIFVSLPDNFQLKSLTTKPTIILLSYKKLFIILKKTINPYFISLKLV